jgi:hypothetical protein
MHEFGHALGMLHEHQSPTGGCGPEYDEEALMAYGALLGWSREKALSNFIPYSASASSMPPRSIASRSCTTACRPWFFKAGD